MIRARRAPTALALAAMLFTGCGGDVEEVPTPPDINTLMDRFEPASIDGELTTETAEALFTGLVADLAIIVAAGALIATVATASDGIEAATGESESSLTAEPMMRAEGVAVGTQQHAITASAGAWARVTHICPGLDDSVDRDNGVLQLQTVLEDLDDVVIWGDALDCIVEGLDGASSVFAAELVIAYEVATGGILGSMIGDMSESGEVLPFSLEMSLIEGIVQLRRDVDGAGAFLVGISNLDGDEATSVTVTDAVGTWTCGYSVEESGVAGRCESDTDEVLTWP